MTPGAYVLCREIASPILNPKHQFIALVPSKLELLSAESQVYGGTRVVVLGAYNIEGRLRARRNAESDTRSFESHLNSPQDRTVTIDRIKLQACTIDGDDFFLQEIYKRFLFFQMWEGNKGEILYPDDVFDQLKSSRFNSNSWAQSLIHWTSRKAILTLVTKNFPGLDVGHDRLIPEHYFSPPSNF